MTNADDLNALAAVEQTLRRLLPQMYQETFDAIEPVAMGSAGLKYHDDGTVSWNEMWGSFCDLAMAGGPPHKGALLEPATAGEVERNREAYRVVVDEICRGIGLVTGLAAAEAPEPGWISVGCRNEGMAAWLLRAITMENVSVRARGAAIELPASPSYRLAREIKNVITVAAKTCHYWQGHIPPAERFEIGDLLEDMSAEAPLLEPEYGVAPLSADAYAERAKATGLGPAARVYAGWMGLECPSVRAALWMMRMLVAGNVLARREEAALFVPVNREVDPDGSKVAAAVLRVQRFAVLKGVISATAAAAGGPEQD